MPKLVLSEKTSLVLKPPGLVYPYCDDIVWSGAMERSDRTIVNIIGRIVGWIIVTMSVLGVAVSIHNTLFPWIAPIHLPWLSLP
jgi:hypothetical protein